MKKLFVFVGDGGSGKSTIITELAKRHPDKFKKVVSCTSRLPRINEVDGVDYHFRSATYFVNNPELVLVKQTDKGDYYGTRKVDLRSDTHHPLLTLRFVGICKLINLGLNNVAIVRISISQDLKVERMRGRGDTEAMIAQRLKYDDEDRAGVSWEGFAVIDLQATDSLTEKVEQIVKAC